MSFAAEYKRMKQQGGAPKITAENAAESDAAAKAKTDAGQVVDDPDAETFAQPFQDGQVIPPTPEALAALTDAPTIPPPKVDAPKKKIKINGKEFESVEEAEAYAAAALAEAEKKEAYAKGLTDANKAPEAPKPAEVKKIKKIADKLFEDPEAAMQELEDYILELADKRVETRDNQKTEAQLKAEQIKKDTDEFYKKHTDLADWQDEVNLVVQKNWTMLSSLPKDQIMVKAAELSRDYVKSVKERALPQQALPSKTVVTPQGGTTAATATGAKATEKKLSFADQVRSTNKRTAAQTEA